MVLNCNIITPGRSKLDKKLEKIKGNLKMKQQEKRNLVINALEDIKQQYLMPTFCAFAQTGEENLNEISYQLSCEVMALPHNVKSQLAKLIFSLSPDQIEVLALPKVVEYVQSSFLMERNKRSLSEVMTEATLEYYLEYICDLLSDLEQETNEAGYLFNVLDI